MKNSVKKLSSILAGWLILGISTLGFSFHKTDTPEKLEKVSVRLKEESYIVINGKTNVNAFQCSYSNALKTGVIDMQVYYDEGCFIFENANFNLNSAGFDCGNNLMNKDFRALLKNEIYPSLNINLHCIRLLPQENLKNLPVASQKKNRDQALVTAEFDIAGHKKEFQIPVEIIQKNKDRMYTGSISINIRDFNLEPPKKMMGMITVDEWIEIDFFVILSLLD